MRNLGQSLALVAVLVLGLLGAAQAQYYDPIQAEMLRLERQIDQRVAEQQRQLREAQQANIRQFVGYYRQQTGDYQTPDMQAYERGINLYCQNNPVECQRAGEGWQEVAARGHALRMGDIRGFGETSRRIGRTNSGILDGSHEGYIERQTTIDGGQRDFVDGVVRQQWTYGNPSTGADYDLPIQPDPHARYTTPEGYPLSFDFNTGTWYVGDGTGSFQPLQPRR